jgi:hypothetical protein
MIKPNITKEDIDNIYRIVQPMLGQIAWSVRLGVGSFVTMEFGNIISITPKNKRGEWLLWIYYCGWYLEKPNGIFIGSGDSRDVLKKEVKVLEGQKLADIEISTVAFDTNFIFDNHNVLHTFPISFCDDCESWKLYTPERKVLLIDPRGKWSFDLANKPRR